MQEYVQEVVARLPDETDEARHHRETAEAREHKRERESWERAFLGSVGKRYVECTLDNYRLDYSGQAEVVAALLRYAENMPEEVADGNGVWLCGPSGTGKDHLLVGLARLAIIDHGIEVMWCNGADLYGELRDRITTQELESKWVLKYTSPPILYISDPVPPRDAMSGHQVTMLERVLDKRNRMMKPTWTSLNIRSSAEADTKMAPALVDRLRDGALGAYCNWPGYRELRQVWPLVK
jgi:DNA replication protein DnaC